MKVLVVSAHPSPESFGTALTAEVMVALTDGAHEARHRDLCAEGFNPVLSPFERLNHRSTVDVRLAGTPELRSHIEDLQWCEAIILVYPTWWSGQPAILKGWFDRILMNDVAWSLPEGASRLKPGLANIRRLVVVTTHGSSKFVNSLEGESGKRTAFRSVRLMFHWSTRTSWIAMYKLDRASAADREAFKRRVRRRVRRAVG